MAITCDMLASMPASKHICTLSVRLPEAELRRFKSIAASRGIRVQEAVREALQIWSAHVPQRRSEPLDALEGSLAGVDVHALRREERHTELRREQRRQ